jgi:protein-tyrosine phosphatase
MIRWGNKNTDGVSPPPGGAQPPVNTSEGSTGVTGGTGVKPGKIEPFAGDGVSKAPVGQGLKSLAVKVDSGAYRTDPLPLDNIVNTYTAAAVRKFIPEGWGSMYMTLLPGKGGSTGSSDKRPRHLGLDMDRIADQKIGTLVTLIEPFELDRYKVPGLFDEAAKRGIKVEHYPIVDVNVPKDMSGTRAFVQKLIGLLQNHESFAVHCAGGKGRTGTIAACVLVELGMNPADAIKQTRIARKGTIETSTQEQFVHQYAKFISAQT